MLFVTHKLNEVTAITDRVTILRDGRTVASLRTADTSAARNRPRDDRAQRRSQGRARARRAPGAPLLEAADLTIARPGGPARWSTGASLTVRGGEIVGIAGVAGNGQSELVEALVGLRRAGRRPGRGLRRAT